MYLRNFHNLGSMEHKQVTKWARRCDVSGKGMMEGWVWLDGSYYTSTEDITLRKCREERESILFNLSESTELQDPYQYEAFNEALQRASVNLDTDKDLLLLGYQSGYLYYTEWANALDIEDEMQWVEIDGCISPSGLSL